MPVLIKSQSHKQLIDEFVRERKLKPDEAQYLADMLHSGQGDYKRPVVSIWEFCTSPYYMGALNADGSGIIWPEVMKAMTEVIEGGYDEFVATGSIGSAKTTACLYLIAYHVYLLSCLENQHQLYGLDPASEISFIIQSLNANVAADVDFQRFKSMIDRSPYFRTYFPYDKTLTSKLRFPNRIVVTPTATNIAGAVGQNVIGGLIDEINSMAVVEKSKRASRADASGIYDEAKALYNVIERRRQSRFLSQYAMRLPGILCLSSSKQYPGEFTDQKIEEARKEIEQYGRTTIYVYDKRVWEVKPKVYDNVEWFRMFVGDEAHKPRILEDDEEVADDLMHLVMEIPEPHRRQFEDDPYGALRDIAGVSTAARHPFIPNVEAISAIFGKHESILNWEDSDFVTHKLKFYPDLFQHKHRKRWVHIDLGVTGDAAGVTCGYVSGFGKIQRGDIIETLPIIDVDFILRVPPPKGGEILFYKIRQLIYSLRESGLPITWVSFDSFQSVDSIQVMRTKGFVTGNISMDRTTGPYDVTKAAIYDNRIRAPKHIQCRKELIALERNPKDGKLDHPPGGQKDCADSLAGVVYGLTTRRETWVDFSIPLSQMPPSIMQVMKAEEERRSRPEVKHPLRPKRS